MIVDSEVKGEKDEEEDEDGVSRGAKRKGW